MMTYRRVPVVAALMFALAFVGISNPRTACAEGKKTVKSTIKAKATIFVQKAVLYRSVCKTGRSLLGLCSRDTSNKLTFTGWKVLKSKTVKGNKLVKLVKLFIDDMKIAEIGNWKIKLSIDIE